MTLILKQLYGLVKLLNSDKGVNQIAAGVACGMVLGFSPLLSLQALAVIVCMFFFRVQIGAATIMAFFFAFLTLLLDPVFHIIGSAVLEIGGLKGFYTTLYNAPIVPFTRFNNSVVMGAGVVSICMAPIVFWGAKKAVLRYRHSVAESFRKSKIWKVIQASSFYKWYLKYEQLFG